MILWCVWLCVS